MKIEDKCREIKLLVTDVDGVLTDGGIIYSSNGNEEKKFNVKDGYICNLLCEEGIELGIITGRKSLVVERRASELGFKYLYQGASDKMAALKKIMVNANFEKREVAFIGDDLNDLEVFKNVGLSATPNDSFDYIKSKVNFVCTRRGGDAAFREFADLILGNR